MKQLSPTAAPPPRAATFTRLRRGSLLVLLALLWGQLASAQAPLINETFEGGALGSFVPVNGSSTNRWVAGPNAGNGASAPGAGAVYISNNLSTLPHAYTTSNAPATVHLYRDVTFPPGAPAIRLSFDWRGVGETVYDNLRVYLTPTTYAPTAGTLPAGAGVTLLQGPLHGQIGYATVDLNLPASLAGSSQRLIFTWTNDNGAGAQPPAAIDNVLLTSQVPTGLSGNYTINPAEAGSATNFRSLTAAINALNANGVAGPATFQLAAGLTLTEAPPAITASGTAANRVTFTRTGSGPNPVLQTAVGTEAGIDLLGADHLTFDGIDVTGGALYGYRVRSASAANGAAGNVIRNARITLSGANNTIGLIQASNGQYGSTSAGAATGLNQGNRYQNLTVTRAQQGIVALSTGASWPEYDLEISGCTLGAADGTAPIGNNATNAYGIRTFMIRRLSVHDNRVLHVVGTPAHGLYLDACQGIGTNLNSATPAGAGNDASNVYNNVVTGIRQFNHHGATSYGLYLTTYNANGQVLNVYNNAIADLTATPYAGPATTTRLLTGFYLGSSGGTNNVVNVWHNSVRLDGSASPNASNTCFELGSSSTARLSFRNNVLANYTGAGQGKHYCLLTPYTNPGTIFGTADGVSDFNDLYVATAANGFVGATGTPHLISSTADKATLGDWRAATSQDPASLDVDPLFESATVLKSSSARLNNQARSIGGIDTDITGASRAAVPDAGAYEFSPAALDLAVEALLTPTATSCYQATDEPVLVQLRNNGSASVTFSPSQPLTVTVQVTGPVTQTLTYTKTATTLAPGDVLSVPVPGPLAMSLPGTYTFSVSISTPGDQAPGNDVLMPAPTRTVRAAVAQPQAVDFTGYANANLSTVFPNWFEGQGASLPVPTDATWTGSTTAVPGNTVARLNLYNNTHQEWLVGPKIVATSSTVFRFKAGISEYNSPLTTPDNTGGMASGTDDALQVMVSTDCGSSFAPVFTISAATGNVPANGGGFTDFVVPLGQYDGQQLIVALKATDGPVDNSADYDVVVDDLYLGTLTADVGVVELLSPANGGCYSATENVRVRVQNYGSAPVSNVPVRVTVGGPVSATLTATLPGPIPANGTADVTVGQVSLTAAGTYTFDAVTQLGGDVTTGNDALPQQTRYQNGLAGLPQQLPFTGFANNLTTLYPGWFESMNGSTAANSSWTSNSPAQRAVFTETAKINIYGAGRYDFLIGPRILATAATRLSFRAGITDYNQAVADPTGMTGTDDMVGVGVSTNCGGSFSHVLTFNARNQPPNDGTLGLYDVDLSAYAGQEIIVAFIAMNGGVSNPSDYDFHLDDVYLRNGVSLDVRPVALAAPQVGGCFSAAEPVLLTVKNDGTSALDLALNPITVTAVVTVPGGGTRTLTGTRNTGTLAAGATLELPAGLLDMSAVGSYSFALTATAAGDANTDNDPLGTAIVRTVTVPSAGTISPGSTGVCENTSVQLTLSGSLNGQVQWQHSTDNVTFTDIPGATGLTYSSPALAANTWFRAQTRCLARVATTAAVAVTVGTPRVVSASSPVRRCGPGNVGLAATLSGGAAARWYDAPTGGAVVSGSASFNLNVTGSRSYYVAAVVTNGSGGECESARTEVQVLIDQTATVDAGPATATVCGGGSYALNGSLGGGATAATWTSTGTGTFAPNATALNASYQPSAADRTAGTVTLRLTTNAGGACGVAQDQLVLTIGGTLSTWTGAFNNDWFEARNWTDCVPDATTDALIPTPGAGRPAPSISGGTATVRHLTVDGTGGLTMSGGLLRVWGGWQHSTTNTTVLSGGTVQFDGDVNQTLSGDVHFVNLTINKTADAALIHSGHIFVAGTLHFLHGRISAGTGPVTLQPGARLTGESETAYVAGRIETTLNLSTADVANDCNGLGLTLTPHGATLPGTTTVLRSTGFFYDRPDGPMRLSIRRTFDIQAAVDQGLNVDLELRYLDSELNGLNESKLTLFSLPNQSSTWNLESHQFSNPAANTVRQNGLSHFSIWTLAEGPTPLPISLLSLSASVQADNQVLVQWETAQERDVLRYDVQASADGRTFRTVGSVLPASPNATSRRQYRFLDREALTPGLRYYRLQEIDQDGTTALFGPRAVQIGRPAAGQLSAAPNPFSSELRLRLSSPTAQPATPLRLLDASGRVVLTRSIEVAAGTTELTLPGLDHLPGGLYLLQLTLNGQPQRLKLLKQ